MLAAQHTPLGVQGGDMTAQANRPSRPERVVLSEDGPEIIGLVSWRGDNPARPWRAYLPGGGDLSCRDATPGQAAEAVRRGERRHTRDAPGKQGTAVRA